MTDPGDSVSQPGAEPEDHVARNIGIGCFTFVIGGFSVGMIAVLVGTGIEAVRRSPKCDGLPICNWYVYAGIGAVLGALSLPTLVLMRLRRRDVGRGTSARG